MINIERSILCSILEHNFTGSDKRIVDMVLNDNFFDSPHHKLFAKGINRLRDLSEPIDSDTLRLKLIEAKKWNFELEDSLLKIMSNNPFGTFDMFMKYYKTLENHHSSASKLHQLKYI